MEVPALGNCFERFLSARKLQALLGFSGVGIIHGLMINLPMTVLAPDFWSLDEFHTNWKPIWSAEKLAILYSSYFFGYLLSTQLTGWAFYNKFKVSPKWVILLAVLLNIVLTLFLSVTFRYDYNNLVMLRFNMGAVGGMALPALKVMLSKWMLPEERAYTRSLVYKSEVIAFAVFVFLAGTSGCNGDWHIALFVMVGLSLIWCILWIVFAHDTPQQQPFISVEERDKIVTALETSKLQFDEPIAWSDVKKAPFLSLLTVNICSTWGLYVFFFKLPMILKTSSQFDMSVLEIGLMLSLSLVGSWLISIGLDKCLNYIQQKNIISPLVARKISVTCATAVPAILILEFERLFHAPYPELRLTLIVFAIMFAGSIFYGQSLDYHDIAPNFADQLSDVNNGILNNVRILLPVVMASLLDFEVCMSTAVLNVIANLVYLIFGDVLPQPSKKSNEDEESCKDQSINV